MYMLICFGFIVSGWCRALGVGPGFLVLGDSVSRFSVFRVEGLGSIQSLFMKLGNAKVSRPLEG